MRVDLSGILAEDGLDLAVPLEEDIPVECREQPEAGHAVAQGDLAGGLAAVLAAEHLVGVEAALGELRLHLREDGGGPGPLVAQDLKQPYGERLGHGGERRRSGCRGIGLALGLLALALALDVGRVLRAGGQVPGHPVVGLVLLVPAPQDLLGDPPEVLDQCQAEHRRHGPELTDIHRGDRLEGLDVPADPGLVQAAVGVRHQRQGQSKDARVAGQRAVGQLGQLRVVAARQVVLDLVEGVLDDVEIIGEPLGLEAPGPGLGGVLDDPAVRLDQDAPVLREAAEQGGAHSGPRGQHGGRREFPGVRLQVIQAEQLGPDRLLAVGVDERRGVTFGEGRDVCRGFFEGGAHVTDIPGSTCPCDRSPFLGGGPFVLEVWEVGRGDLPSPSDLDLIFGRDHALGPSRNE